MNTKLAADLGLEFPIFAFTHCRDVAAAVSKAGGLGVLGVAAHSLENLDVELEWIEKEVNGKPYGVDLLLPTKFVGSDRGGFDAALHRSKRSHHQLTAASPSFLKTSHCLLNQRPRHPWYASD